MLRFHVSRDIRLFIVGIGTTEAFPNLATRIRHCQTHFTLNFCINPTEVNIYDKNTALKNQVSVPTHNKK